MARKHIYTVYFREKNGIESYLNDVEAYTADEAKEIVADWSASDDGSNRIPYSRLTARRKADEFKTSLMDALSIHTTTQFDPGDVQVRYNPGSSFFTIQRITEVGSTKFYEVRIRELR